MNIKLKLITSSFILALTLVAPQLSHASAGEDFGSNALVVASSPTTAVVVRKLGDDVTGPEEPRFQNGLDKNILKVIFEHASDIGANPGDLDSVCLYWSNVMREIEGPVNARKYVLPEYSSMNNFMKNCMRLYSSSLIRNMQLTHTNPKTGYQTVMKIPADADPLKYVFKSVIPIFRNIRFTTSVEEFFKVRKENENKLVILVSTYAVIKDLHEALFSVIIGEWDPAEAKVGLFLRHGNWDDLSCYYLTKTPVAELSVVDMYKNWSLKGRKACADGRVLLSVRVAPGTQFHVSFLN